MGDGSDFGKPNAGFSEKSLFVGADSSHSESHFVGGGEPHQTTARGITTEKKEHTGAPEKAVCDGRCNLFASATTAVITMAVKGAATKKNCTKGVLVGVLGAVGRTACWSWLPVKGGTQGKNRVKKPTDPQTVS